MSCLFYSSVPYIFTISHLYIYTHTRTGLQWFGISKEKYFPQLASSGDAENFLNQHKRILNEVWEVDDK